MTVEQGAEIIELLGMIQQILGQFIGVFYLVLGCFVIWLVILTIKNIFR